MKKIVAIAVLALGVSNLAQAKDILSSIAEDGSYKTFLSAVKTAGLEDTLKGKGPLTVFVPNDAAFAKLPKDKLNALLANKAELKKVLTYHVYPNSIVKADVDAGEIKTLEGESLKLSVVDGVKVNGIRVVGNEINADNGVVHAVDGVLMPKN